jgi:hypothetical protein
MQEKLTLDLRLLHHVDKRTSPAVIVNPADKVPAVRIMRQA